MRLKEFLDFNSNCPICGEPLHLYMQWTHSYIFKASRVEPDSYMFEPSNDIFKNDGTDDDSYMMLSVADNVVSSAFSNSKLLAEAKKHHIYFYFICNPAGIKKESWGDYKINLYKGCYYRATPLMELQRDEDSEIKKWNLNLLEKDNQDLIQKHESYSFKTRIKNNERVYMLDLDWEKKETSLWFYSVTEEEKKIKGFKPNIFEKKMPLLKNRPKVDLENRQRLLDRFDGWIIMS